MIKCLCYIYIVICFIGCDPQFYLSSDEVVVQYCDHPQCFLLIGKLPTGAEQIWKNSNCYYSNKNLPIFTINVGDSISVLSKTGIQADSVFNISINDTLFTTTRLLSHTLRSHSESPGCYYVFPLSSFDGNKLMGYQITRFIDIISYDGIVKKVNVHFWAN
jgi:hypothetical protein